MANGEKVMNGEKVKRTRMGKKDFAKLGVVVAYIVQHRGHARTKDVEDALLNQCLVTVNSRTVCSVMEALRKKGILLKSWLRDFPVSIPGSESSAISRSGVESGKSLTRFGAGR